MRSDAGSRWKTESGQNLIEVALLTPFLLLIAFNAINYGYYFFVAINLAAAPRQAVEYAVQGGATPAQISLPSGGPASNLLSVSALAYADISNSLPSFGTASVQVCSKTVGTLNNPGTTTQSAKCCVTTSSSSSCATGTGTFPPAASDPESPYFVLQRVDIKYTVNPLIPGTVFGISLLPSFNFHQQVSMRALD
ncbi:MAG: TadE/TadG family type IV pilus assembly protein [Acidobacteriaceae bacterium]